MGIIISILSPFWPTLWTGPVHLGKVAHPKKYGGFAFWVSFQSTPKSVGAVCPQPVLQALSDILEARASWQHSAQRGLGGSHGLICFACWGLLLDALVAFLC